MSTPVLDIDSDSEFVTSLGHQEVSDIDPTPYVADAIEE